jgi:hypothetical protein
MRKIYLIMFLMSLITLFGVSATQFNLPSCWVTNSLGISIDSNCDGILDASNVNLSAYINQSQITTLLNSYVLITNYNAGQLAQNNSLGAVYVYAQGKVNNATLGSYYNTTLIDAQQLAQNNSLGAVYVYAQGKVNNASLGSYALIVDLNSNISAVNTNVQNNYTNLNNKVSNLSFNVSALMSANVSANLRIDSLNSTKFNSASYQSHNQDLNTTSNISASNFLGYLNWSYVLNAPFTVSDVVSGDNYIIITMNGMNHTISLNDSTLNTTILNKASVYNDSLSINSVNSSLTNEISGRQSNDSALGSNVSALMSTNVSANGRIDSLNSTKLSINGSGNLGNITFNGGFGGNGVSITGGNYWGDGNLFLSGNITAVNVQLMTLNTSFTPTLNNSFDIGNSLLNWRNGYFNVLYEKNQALNTIYSSIVDLNSNISAVNTNVQNNYTNLNNKVSNLSFNVSALMSANVSANLRITSLNSTKTQNNTNVNFTSLIVVNNATFDNGTLMVDTTNNRVGINSMLPNSALDVRGNINVTGNLTVSDRIVFNGNVYQNNSIKMCSAFSGLPCYRTFVNSSVWDCMNASFSIIQNSGNGNVTASSVGC